MNQDYQLRTKNSGQVGAINVLQATYHPTSIPKNLGLQGFSSKDLTFSKPLLAKNLNDELLNPIFPKEDDANPSFREKYKLPKKDKSLWFDSQAYTSYP